MNSNQLGYRDEGNKVYPPAAGKSYHGRGPIQLSYNYNYGQVSEFLFGDKNVMLANPERVIEDSALAFQTAIWFWMTPQHPKPSAHDVMAGNWQPNSFDQGKNRKAGFGMTVNIINGGLECGKGGGDIPKVTGRIGFYNRFAGILGTSTDLDGSRDCSECGCANMGSYGGSEPDTGSKSSIQEKLAQATEVTLVANPVADIALLNFRSSIDSSATISIYNLNGQKSIRKFICSDSKRELFE